MTESPARALAALGDACAVVGLDAARAGPIRIAENQVWRLRDGVVARIAPPGRLGAAMREVTVARWLSEEGFPAVEPLPVAQPLERQGLVFTFWREVPPHTHGSTLDVAAALKRLHALRRPPDFDIGGLEPFVRLPERLAAAQTLPPDDRRWLLDLHDDLVQRWAIGLPQGLPAAAIHGDAWPGNIVRLDGAGWLVMDLERFCLGPPEWDLVSTAVRTRTTGATTEAEYDAFCDTYGHDVTTWNGYELLAAIRELRMTAYAAQHAAGHTEWRAQAQHRVDCLRGRNGPRPWHWTGIL